MSNENNDRNLNAVSQVSHFWPIAMLALMSGLLLIGGIMVAIRKFDAVSLGREQSIVENGIRQRVEELSLLVIPQVVWDDAVANLDNRFDKSWADQNLGTFLSDVNGFASVFVLNGSGRPIYASEGGAESSLAAYREFADAASVLIAEVRTAERKRPPLKPALDASKMITTPIYASGITMIGGRPEILTATLVQPDFGAALPRGARSPIVLTSMAMDSVFLEKLKSRYMLEALHIRGKGVVGTKSGAHVALNSRSGTLVATLDWVPQRPGTTLLRQLILPLLAVLAFLATVALMLVRKSSRAANNLIASEARATHLAYHDNLTGLPNRLLMFDRLQQALNIMRRSERPLAVHCLDLDRFKDVNDTLGHHAGDELIRIAAHRLNEVCRNTDTVARLGGDEFVVIQPNSDASKAERLASRIIEALSKPIDLTEGQVQVGCSIGITIVSNPDSDSAEILRQSDMALYKAKAAGRGQAAFFEIEMDAALKMRRGLENDLRAALTNGTLHMVYQPQVDKHNKMMGVEALIRWDHPTRGPISPAIFVPLAEECGIITDLGMFALRRVFSDSRKWAGLRVAINVSPIQLRSPLFAQVVEKLVDELRVDVGRYEIEITETALLGDDVITKKTLRKLKKLGFSIALDDFGTGYSSLSYLQKYPVNKIKIDRSFISNLGVDAESEAVVEAIVKLARALNLDVIAEGVETSDQRKRLTSIGCSEVQGFLYSKGVKASDVDSLMKSRSADMVEAFAALN